MYFRNIVFGLSDIDLTFFFLKESSLFEQKRCVRKFFFLRKLFSPLSNLFSEINIYSEKDIHFIDYCINPLELKRDPFLIKKANLSLAPPSIEQKLVYAIKMLHSDRKNLLTRPQLRLKKWRFHIAQLFSLNRIDELDELDELNFSILLNILDKNIFIHFSQLPIQSVLEKYLFYEKMPDLTRPFSIEHKTFLLLFPIQWLAYQIHFDLPKHKVLAQLTLKEQVIYEEQLKWELWGIYTQLHSGAIGGDLETHLKHISQTVDCLRTEHAPILKAKCHILIDRARDWKDF